MRLNQSDARKRANLTLIKSVHTLIWLFFNVVIFYMLYAVINNKLDVWLWVGYGLIVAESITLLIFNKMCPLTIVARRYSQSQRYNFDIYLPEWLARYNKQLYSVIVLIVIVITVYKLYRS